LCIIDGDRRQLQQVFQNIIGNALKYSKQDVPPSIAINCTKVNGPDVRLKNASLDENLEYHQITISDNGIGFDQRDAERIFDMFTRLHGTTQFNGTGIGLSIVMRVMQNHDGFIEAESELGKGSVFKLYLPEREPVA
jgi:signal transduction histidine kinase